jgi:hypothetical protein
MSEKRCKSVGCPGIGKCVMIESTCNVPDSIEKMIKDGKIQSENNYYVLKHGAVCPKCNVGATAFLGAYRVEGDLFIPVYTCLKCSAKFDQESGVYVIKEKV